MFYPQKTSKVGCAVHCTTCMSPFNLFVDRVMAKAFSDEMIVNLFDPNILKKRDFRINIKFLNNFSKNKMILKVAANDVSVLEICKQFKLKAKELAVVRKKYSNALIYCAQPATKCTWSDLGWYV